MWVDIIGYIASGIIAIYMFPIIYKAYRYSDIQINFLTLALQTLASILFIIYGIFAGMLIPIIVCNGILVLCCLLTWIKILCTRFYNEKNKKSTANVAVC